MMRVALLATVALCLAGAAHAQTQAAPAGTSINPYGIKIGTTPGTVAGGDALAAVAQVVNVKSLGAVGSAKTGLDGTIAAGTTAFTSALTTFTQADVGKTIQIDGALGAAAAPLVTTIAAYVGPHAVTLAAPATASVPQSYATLVSTASPGATGSYVIGDVFQTQGGAGSAAAFKVSSLQVASATVESQGTNAPSGTNVACPAFGTTGTGYKFGFANATVTNGVLSLGSPTYGGQYVTAPTNIAAEPLATSCGILGATASIHMGPSISSVATAGSYTAKPTGPIATGAGSISGATGATVNINWQQTGSFAYGVDDTAAFAAAINKTIALFAAGKQAYVYAPTDAYLINGATLPTFYQTGGGIVGDGQMNTRFILGASYVGDLFSWSQNYVFSYQPYNGASGQVTANPSGPVARGFSVAADRFAPAQQNALTFYDQNDYVHIDDVTAMYLNGRCFSVGAMKNAPYSFMRESRIHDLRCFNDGSISAPVFELNAAHGDSSNNIDLDNVDIYAPGGIGMVLRASSGVAGIRASRVRIEGLEQGSAGNQGDLLQIGDSTLAGTVAEITFKQLEVVDPYVGYSSIHILSPNAASQPYEIEIDANALGGGAPLGKGINIQSGRDMGFHTSGISSVDTNLTVGPSAGGVGTGLVLDVDEPEALLTTNIDPTSAASLNVRALKNFTSGLLQGTGVAGALQSPSNDSGSLLVGQGALQLQTTGINNTGVGIRAGQYITSGQGNTAVGENAGQFVSTGSTNTSVGNGAGISSPSTPLTGGANTSVGAFAGASLQGGNSSNTMLGQTAGINDTIGAANTVVGQGAASSLVTGGSNIILGQNVDIPGGADGSNQISIGGVLLANRVTGHVALGGTALTAAKLSACGTSPAIATGSTDAVGAITAGTGATGCTLTFGTVYAASPSCVVTSRSGLPLTYAPAGGALVLSAAGLGGTVVDYDCHNLGNGAL